MREVLANQKRGNILNEDRLHNLAKQGESFKVAPSCALSYDERFFIIFFSAMATKLCKEQQTIFEP